MEKITVLGLGNFGTALGNHLAQKGYDVLGWSIEQPVVGGINSKGKNPIYLSDVQLDPRLRATASLEEVLDRPIVVMVFPSFALSQIVPKLKVKPGTHIISAIKGMDESTLMTPLQYAEKHLPVKADLSLLSGPSFAKEIVVQRPCGIVAASKTLEVAERTADLFSSDSMRVYLSLDPLGVEIGATVKNVIALAVGICDGMELGDSARAGLITRGLAEMMRLATAVGGDVRTLSGLSGLGDLVMTATCDTSRNRTVGLRLGRGEKLDYIVDTLGSVAEGVKTTHLVLKLAEKHSVDMPITSQVATLLRGEITPAELVRRFIVRPRKMEF